MPFQIRAVDNYVDGGERTIPKPVMDGKAQAGRIDRVSRTIFPLAFMLFNIVYWIVYTLTRPVQPAIM